MVMVSAAITAFTLSLAVVVSTIAFHLRGLHNSLSNIQSIHLRDPYMYVLQNCTALLSAKAGSQYGRYLYIDLTLTVHNIS
jgi:hypothetical protein